MWVENKLKYIAEKTWIEGSENYLSRALYGGYVVTLIILSNIKIQFDSTIHISCPQVLHVTNDYCTGNLKEHSHYY